MTGQYEDDQLSILSHNVRLFLLSLLLLLLRSVELSASTAASAPSLLSLL